ncbi:hypothetical protein [Yokenella regensburgei]|uniref:hypothetical protein n=1 Tax=Yokenella regensburgei TaxID=158877 RepID=UPI001375A637|nr:hypothetical protein [Yokenella regensburgei]KAF1366475.1 hypothetical protein FHR25_005057 [Yokenella regensburgei]
MSDNEKLTIDQKIAIAKIAVEAINGELAAKTNPGVIFGSNPKQPLFHSAYNELYHVITGSYPAQYSYAGNEKAIASPGRR